MIEDSGCNFIVMQVFVAILFVTSHSIICFVWLQIDIDDGYETLTNKTIMSMAWAIGYCGRHFTFLLKTDDDSFNVPQRFVEYLSSLADSDTDNFAFVGGLCSSGEVPHRNHGHKWFVPHSSYPGPVFPHHCKVSTV